METEYVTPLRTTPTSSDVMIIKIQTEITIFKKNRTESILQFFGANVNRFRHRIALEGPAIGVGGHRMGFTLPPPPTSPITPSAEFISMTL